MLWSEVSSGSCPTTQVSFEPPPCELLTTSWPPGSATRVSPPGSTQISVPSLTANGRRSAWRGRMPSSTSVGMVDSCTTGWAIQPRGSARRRAASSSSCLGLASGPDDEPLAARAVDRLHDELVEAVEHLLERARLLEPPGLHVRQDRVLGEVVPDEVGQVGVDELVVGDAVADRVRDRHVAEARREQEAGRAEHRVGAELQRVEELVVDAAVDHVDAGRAGGRAHPDPAAGAEQVAALDQLDAHQAREQGVLEVRRVVDARGQHDDRRILDAVRGRGAQRAEQPLRVVADRPHPHAHEQLGQGLRHDPAVRDDVADAARHAHVVFEHAPGALLVADEVDAGDLDAHVVRADDARRLAVELVRRADQPRRDDAVLDGPLLAVDVGEERLERRGRAA